METVKIGNRVWMNYNLNVDNFRNGDTIPEAKTDEEWANAIKNNPINPVPPPLPALYII